MLYKILILFLLLGISLQAQKKNRPSALKNDKFFTRNGHEMLYGGDQPQQDFVIDNLELKKRPISLWFRQRTLPGFNRTQIHFCF